MLDFSRVQNYCIVCGYTDMRKQIDGLVAVVELQFKQKPDETSIFLFCGRRADRMSLALAEPFPDAKVSEDAHTWMRYGAHPGRFVFPRDIRNHYRIRTGTQSQSRSRNLDFYAMKAAMDRDGFEQALVIAARHGRVEEQAAQEIRTRFYVRLALSMLRGPDIEQATLCLQDAWAINHRTALAALADLEAGEDEKQILLALIHTHDKTQKSCSGTACSELIHH